MNLLKKPYENLDCVQSRFVELYGEKNQSQFERYQVAFTKFKNLYGYNCAYVASSSGRVEVCGNHTDHNGGKVVSCAISLDTLAFFMPTDDNVIRVTSEGYPEMIIDINEQEKNEEYGTSSALIKGVCVGLQNLGYNVGGFTAFLTSNVLGGAGISSSASFEVLIAEILNFLYNEERVNCEEKAKVSQFAENVYFGKPCGLLDQTAISFGGLKKLDFSNKNKIIVEDVKCDLSGYTFILINTGGSHADLTDEYASIPNEMRQVANAFSKDRLIEVDKEEFFENVYKFEKLSDRAVLRAIHFYNENDRVDNLASMLTKGDYNAFLQIIRESGISSWAILQNCYVASGVDQKIPRALALASRRLNGGANRVHGGGFAGTILNIVKNEDANTFILEMNKIFGSKNVIPLKVRTIGTIVL